MISDCEYQKITKNIAGARTKSRFTYEIAHGVNMVYEEYRQEGDFFIIFDYSCDLEKGKGDKISFYQLKTKTTGSYTIDSLLKITPPAKKSILQTLVDLKSTDSVDKLYIVSNKTLSNKDFPKNISNAQCIPFSLFDEKIKKKINESITWPMKVADFDNLFFCVSDIMVKEADNSLIGLTDTFLNSIYPSSYTNPSCFKKCIMNFAREKADYEMDTLTLQDTIEKKGITRRDVDRLLDEYRKGIIQTVIPPFEIISNWIEKLDLTMKIAINLKRSYNVKCSKAYFNEQEKALIKTIYDLYQNNYCNLTPTESIKMIVANFPNNNIIIGEEDKYLYAIIAYEKGGI